MIVKALNLQFIGISERNFLIVVEAKRCGGESERTKQKRISLNSDLLKQWITKTTHGDEWFRDLFSLDFALSEFLRDPGGEDTTEWDPAQEQHSYYHINPSENISYRYSYDTGEKEHLQKQRSLFIGAWRVLYVYCTVHLYLIPQTITNQTK